MFEAPEIDQSASGRPEGSSPATPRPIRRVCVYCGSSQGTNPAYVEAAGDFGASLAKSGFDLVYGGGSHGLMGVVAQSVLTHGGYVTGIIPTCLTHQCRTALIGAHDLIVVDHMHARKQAMFDRADAFVALPGGVGTLEELVEQMTWLKLGHHTKPLIIADIQGFWHPLLQLLNHMSTCGFIGTDRAAPYQVARSIEEVMMLLRGPIPTPAENDGSWRHNTGIEAPRLGGNAEFAGVSPVRGPGRADAFVEA